MRDRSDRRVPLALRRAAARFEQWRRVRERGTRIPQPLWMLAAGLAATHGVCRTASTLKLDYYGLKRRVEASAGSSVLAGNSTRQPPFLELPATLLAPPGECLIEFENSSGARMRVHLKGITAPDLAALSRSFWSAE